jgi:hypothetical protein
MEMAIKLLKFSLLQSNLQLDGLSAMGALKLRPLLWNKVCLLHNVWRASLDRACKRITCGKSSQQNGREDVHGV